jgi:RNA polymerase sigma-70 factor (ECF subfamily)
MEKRPAIAIDELLAHAGWVRELALALVGDAASADDLVQDTWIAAMRGPSEGPMSPRPWLARVMRNLARDRWRREERRRRHEVEAARADSVSSSADLAGELEMQRTLGTALTELDEPLQSALIRRYFHGSSAAEIATIENISERTARDRIQRGIDALRAKLDGKFGDRSTWAALLIPLARRAASASAAGSATTVGWMALSAVWKTIAALAFAAALAGWFATREANPLHTVPLATDTELARPATLATNERVESQLASVRAPATTPASLDETRLTVHLVRTRTLEPIVGVRVTVTAVRPKVDSPDGPPKSGEEVHITSGTTDSAGEVTLKVPPRVPFQVSQNPESDMNVISGDEAPLMWGAVPVEPLSAGEHRTITMKSDDARVFTFWARAVSDEDAHPIADPIVRAIGFGGDIKVDSGWTRGPSKYRIRGDAQGYIELRMTYAQPALLRLLVGTPEFGPGLFAPDLNHESRDAAAELKVARSSSLQGLIVDLRGIERTTLSVELKAESYWLKAFEGETTAMYGYSFSWSATCGAQGDFAFSSLPARVHFSVEIRDGSQVVLTMPGGAPDSLVLNPGEAKHVDWTIGGGARVRGLALDKDSQPVHGHEIWLVRHAIDAVLNPGPTCLLRSDDRDSVVAHAKTDDRGQFEFPSVDSGEWFVGIAPSGDVDGVPKSDDVTPFAAKLDIKPGDQAVNVTLQPPHTLYIRGVVLAPDGTPMSKAEIGVGTQNTSFFTPSATSSDDGTFSIGPMAPGSKRLRASAWWQHTNSDEVEVEAGASNVILRLKVGASVSGFVRCTPQDDKERVDLYLSKRGATGGEQTESCGSSSGFRFDGLDAGTYSLVARSSAGRVGAAFDIVVESGAETKNVMIDLVRGATLTVRYRGSREGSFFYLLWNDARMGWGEVKNGSWQTFTVPAGRVVLRHPTHDGDVDREVVTRAGAETEIVLEDP